MELITEQAQWSEVHRLAAEMMMLLPETWLDRVECEPAMALALVAAAASRCEILPQEVPQEALMAMVSEMMVVVARGLALAVSEPVGGVQ
jgi:hypothetical protein